MPERRNYKQFKEARLEQIYLHEPFLLDYRITEEKGANVFKFINGNKGYIRKIDEEVS